MNRAPAEMLHNLSIPGISAKIEGMEMSALEKQRIALNWQQQQQLQLHPALYQQHNCSFNEAGIQSLMPTQPQIYQGLTMDCGLNLIQPSPNLDELLNQPMKIDPGEHGRSIDFNDNQSIQSVVEQTNSLGYELNHGIISRTASCPPLVAAAQGKGRHHLSDQKLTAPTGRESFKKRKAEKCLPPKQGNPEEDNRSKKSKGCAEEESKITEQISNRKSNSSQSNHKESSSNNNNDKKNKEAIPSTSKDNSKASEAQKPDYIHVRARRGQATDSHSLAERVRREKISERMKYLQDLVPGCNKITGKAGMLDEIINYVQSLQRQVEFLSMKLAAVNLKIDFNIEDLIAKQVFATCSTSMPTIGIPPDMTNAMCLQYNPIKQDNVYGSELAVNQLDMGLRRSISAPTSLPETFIDPSTFNQISSSIPWDANLKNIYAMECQQGRPVPSQLQTFTDNIEASAL